MTDDLIYRLLNIGHDLGIDIVPAAREAADEIRRLRAALQQIAKVEPEYAFHWGMQCIEIAERALEQKAPCDGNCHPVICTCGKYQLQHR